MNRKNVSMVLCMFSAVLCMVHCSPANNSDKRVISINDYHITSQEFNEMYDDSFKKDETQEHKKAFIDSLISRKLILQKAQTIGLDTDPEFLKSIENFWEQSLLKIMIDHKTSQVAKMITVSDEEVNNAYSDWLQDNPETYKTPAEIKKMIEKKLLREKQKEYVRQWIQDIREESEIYVDKEALGIS